jgi:hypothetical protein
LVFARIGHGDTAPWLHRGKPPRGLYLFGEFVRRPRRTVRLLTVWQTPWALVAKGQSEQFPEGEFVFVAIRGDANSDFVLRNVAPQRAMKLVPPAENCSPIGIGLTLHNGVMNAVHARGNENVV